MSHALGAASAPIHTLKTTFSARGAAACPTQLIVAAALELMVMSSKYQENGQRLKQLCHRRVWKVKRGC